MQKKYSKEFTSLAQFVISKRTSMGLSQEELAQRCALGTDIIKSIEQGLDLFLATTIRQKLAHGLKVDNKEIKLYESKPSFDYSKSVNMDEIRELILMNYTNPDFSLNCPICGSKLSLRVAKLYDLEDNLILRPKAQCTKCPFQLKD